MAPKKRSVFTYLMKVKRKMAMSVLAKIDFKIILTSNLILNLDLVLFIKTPRKKMLLIMVAIPAPRIAYS